MRRAHALDPLGAEAEGLARLRAFRHGQAHLAIKGRDLDLTPKCRSADRHRHFAMQVVAVALEHLVRLDADLDIEVARRAAVHARFAFSRQPDPLALVDALRDVDFEHLVLLDPPFAVAGQTRIGDHLAGAMAGRTRLLNRKKSLRHAHRAGAVAGAARLGTRAGLGTAAMAGLAVVPRRHANVGRESSGRLFERDLHVVAQIGAAKSAAAGSTARTRRTAENVAENVAEGIGKIAEALAAATAKAAAGRARIDPGMTEAVIGGALLGVGQNLVCLFRLLEFFFRLLGVFVVTLIAIGVMLHRQLAIGLLDFVFAGVFGQAQHVVKVALAHLLSVLTQ